MTFSRGRPPSRSTLLSIPTLSQSKDKSRGGDEVAHLNKTKQNNLNIREKKILCPPRRDEKASASRGASSERSASLSSLLGGKSSEGRLHLPPLRRPPDGSNIRTVENPHFVTLCRFLNIFDGLLNLSWNFSDIINCVETNLPADEFTRSLFLRLFNLMGKRATPNVIIERLLERFTKERKEDYDFEFLLGSDCCENLLSEKEWHELMPHQRLRIIRIVLNITLGESAQIQKALEDKSVNICDEDTGFIAKDKNGDTYWFISEKNNEASFKLYREITESVIFEVLADDTIILENIAESMIQDKGMRVIGETLKAKHQSILSYEKARSRAARQHKAMARQLESLSLGSSWEVSHAKRSERLKNFDYTFSAYDEAINRAERASRYGKVANEDLETYQAGELGFTKRSFESSQDRRNARLAARNAIKEQYRSQDDGVVDDEKPPVMEGSSAVNGFAAKEGYHASIVPFDENAIIGHEVYRNAPNRAKRKRLRRSFAPSSFTVPPQSDASKRQRRLTARYAEFLEGSDPEERNVEYKRPSSGRSRRGNLPQKIKSSQHDVRFIETYAGEPYFPGNNNSNDHTSNNPPSNPLSSTPDSISSRRSRSSSLSSSSLSSVLSSSLSSSVSSLSRSSSASSNTSRFSQETGTVDNNFFFAADSTNNDVIENNEKLESDGAADTSTYAQQDSTKVDSA